MDISIAPELIVIGKAVGSFFAGLILADFLRYVFKN